MVLSEIRNKFKVLIIDDEKTMADILAQRLNRSSDLIDTHVLSDPGQAVPFLKQHTFQIILLDYRMKNISGVDCLKSIRAEFPKVDLPVIMLTSEEASGVMIQSFDEGANDYIVKGSPMSVIVSRILSHLSFSTLMREEVRIKELQAVMALVVACNHQINNPLSIAISSLESLKKDVNDVRIEKLESALWRISEVVKSLKTIGEKYELEYVEYSEESKMLKLK
jgi:PleD family two-component response regulator